MNYPSHSIEEPCKLSTNLRNLMMNRGGSNPAAGDGEADKADKDQVESLPLKKKRKTRSDKGKKRGPQWNGSDPRGGGPRNGGGDPRGGGGGNMNSIAT